MDIKESISYLNLSFLFVSNNKYCVAELVVFCHSILTNRTTEFLNGLSFNSKHFFLLAIVGIDLK